ncbi:diacylglycerol kinase [Legionella israelensis]|uniref:Diacylglycerol kinase n=1 Tax=Legionella israelensis TaxID=454 RepID=A0A0W0WNL2_9GAMM|nr:diacylglycerol kinase family protein [Legionella israelensis]KTD33924.1 Diacylglycerol kinase [Legionella israelensis]QBR83647.1 diacylglycerol kinase [Legionella israelensis]QBS08912.1 diacylglycerol kinase [Legionella israelensis]SCX82742.1 Diacylglycerol kinase family enzyme [Legionella israelensis DSM 19235]STX58600.1 Diacylglycerol kinase [Legionella israelensis]
MSNIAVIFNQKAKNASLISQYLEHFSQHHIDYTSFETRPDKLKTIIKHCQKDYSLLLIGGGDGTVRTAAELCCHSSFKLGIIPLGTMNHFVKELSLPANPDELTHALKQMSTITIDLSEVNQRIFVNNASIGFYPRFAYHRNHYHKFYNKWLSYLPGFIQACKFNQPLNIEIKNQDLNLSLATSFFMISNNMYSYQFPIAFRRENFNEGLLGIYVYKYKKLPLKNMIHALFNPKKNFTIKQSSHPIEVHIKNKKNIDVALDGEIIKMKTPLLFKPLPNALTLLTGSQ